MPVRSTDLINPMGLLDDLSSDMLPSPVVDVISARPNTEPVLSDDIWNKFELDFPELSGIDDIFDEIDTNDDSLLPFLNGICQIRNHDCMWAGHCASKEHPTDEPRFHMYCAINSSAPGYTRAPIVTIKRESKPPVPCQQSLLKPAVRAAACVVPVMSTMHTPQTPPMSDDEETKCKPTQVLQILNQTIAECDLDDDSDLCDYRGGDYFDDDEDIEVNVTDPSPAVKETAKSNIRSCQFAAESDHSYHKDKNASMHMPNLGIDTPSDSEEEIDVVSVTGEKSTINNRICSLPTNPSVRDRQQIQRRMATAISKNRINGIKTILPIRKTSTENNAQTKRKLPESRVVKRTRQYRTSNNSPYKRRSTLGNSSDSEAEPSEKRSLHNNMERQRRIDLRNAFEDLRLLIPEVSKKEKAAKVVILREASKYCYQLGNTSVDYNNQLNELRREQEQLRRRVSQLRRSLAAAR
ncbi:transcriptional regulator Myc-1 isoform X2 [Anoplophora glabripennis]|uniref:transcriptional regulator Myc-1 isoform X2 n=1 Tax=Anoplophora glabripennis TaxID=217634 RepID=UPI0008756968|nr:transcriptional regulator Myc-1 isoform X2 [Anoplophora glabripennis]XP_018569008.1 transcriptional regulator Myc-1 isoform X2 [Anoplophora glabripennis]